MNRNGFRLIGKLAWRGYDWWWHSLVGMSKHSGEERPFFIEYFVINPALGGEEPILGQLEENQRQGIRPSYAMLKAGSWGKNAVEINNFYGIRDFSASVTHMDVRIGRNLATETYIKGSVKLSEKQAAEHPEFMSAPGEMSWELSAQKVLDYDVGFGASLPMRLLNAFQMYWHVQGMKTLYKGTIVFNGEEFEVTPKTCFGYQDKNWGSDYTNPWLWLNCNNFTSRASGKKLARTSLVVGGARPVLFGKPLAPKLLIAFYHEGQLYDFNWTKICLFPRQQFDCQVDRELGTWDIVGWNTQAKIEIHFTCSTDGMLRLNYENPDGQKNHHHLWNGGYASGIVKLYRRTSKDFELIDTFDGELGGCEYGVY